MDLGDIRRHLRFLSMGYDKKYFWEIRVVDEKGVALREFYDDPLKIADLIEANPKFFEDKNVFVSLLPRKDKVGGREGVAEGNTFVIDVDFEEVANDEIANEIIRTLTEKFVKPSLVVKSGRGFHIYWKVNKNFDPEKWERIQKGLINKVSSLINYKIDKQVCDCSRTIRLAGTFNNKQGNRYKTYIILPDFSVYDSKYFENLEVKEVRLSPDEVNIFKRKLRKFNKIVKLFEGFWVPGHRDLLTFWLIGMMIKLGYSKDSCYKLIDALTTVYNDEEKKHRLYLVEFQYKRIGRVKFKGVSGLIEEFLKIARENGIDEVKAINRASKIMKLLGVKKSEYLPKVIDELISRGVYHFNFFRYFNKLSEDSKAKLIEMAIERGVKESFLLRYIRRLINKRKKMELVAKLLRSSSTKVS